MMLLTLLALGGVVAACGEEDESAEPETPVDEVTVDQLLMDPDAFDGAVVIVREATVVPIEPEGGFVLEGEQGRILVSAPSGTPELEAGESVPVRAEVVRFTEPAAEALGEEFADAEELAETPTDVGDPYLLLRALPESGAAAAVPADTAEELSDERAALAAVVEAPDGRYGDEVALAGEVVRSGERAFVLGAEDAELLIVPQSDRGESYDTGTVVRAEGTVERIPAGEDDPAGIGEEELFDEFEGEPTLAATSIEVVDR